MTEAEWLLRCAFRHLFERCIVNKDRGRIGRNLQRLAQARLKRRHTMLVSKLNATAVIAIVLVLCLGRSDSFATQQPARDKPKVKPADNTPRPYRVIGDRR